MICRAAPIVMPYSEPKWCALEEFRQRALTGKLEGAGLRRGLCCVLFEPGYFGLNSLKELA